MKWTILLTTFLLVSLVRSQTSDANEEQTKKCGYEACNAGNKHMLNVHIVCHTHDDVGWVLTVEQYYRAYVRDIIHSVIFHLNQDENRRFVYVESAFFRKWWDEQSGEMRNRVKDLVRSGRLEFVGGGWVMNDEAVTHYSAIVDQMTLGMRFLNDTFGECAHPKTVWQIDPFGHSREQASLFSQMGFDGLFLGRIDYQDIEVRRKRKTMEFLWKGSPSLGRSSEIFTGILPNVYWPPKGFCFDVNCWDEEITDQNALQKARDFIHLVKEQAKQYRTNHTIITMGMDFYYRHAGKWYRNLEQLMSKINSLQANGSDVNIFFSTPSCYLKSLHDEGVTWHTETEDFFPYASQANSYWTGYYTSRPTSKFYSRKASAFLQTCKQMVAFGSMPTANIFSLQSAVGVMQHHDALTGTEKLHVSRDYAKSLADGISECQVGVKTVLSRLISNITDSRELYFCNLLNQTECHFTEAESLFQVIIYNSLSRPVSSVVRLPVRGEAFVVRDQLGQQIPSQIVPLWSSLRRIPERTSLARFELVFPAPSLPPLGATTFTVQKLRDFEPTRDAESVVRTPTETLQPHLVIENERVVVKVSTVTGLLEKVVVDGEEMNLKQTFHYYTSQPGFQNEKASGAYSFNPLFDSPLPVSGKVNATVVKGLLVQEIRQEFNPWISQVIRLYRGQPFLEFDWIVGPIPTKDYNGKEVVTRFETDFTTRGAFFTDANSKETIKRVRNFRPTWNLTVDEPIAGNYYPVTGWIYIRDENSDHQLTVLTDRAQGGSSILDGSLEVMVHRRTLYDDGYGVDEAMNEMGVDGKGLVARGKHWVVLGSTGESTKLIKELSKELYHEPNFVFRTLNESRFRPEEPHLHFTFLSQNLPVNVHLLTVEMLSHVEVLVRLEHMYEAKEDPIYSTPVSIPLRNLFCPFSIESVRETTLSAHQYADTLDKLRWKDGSKDVADVMMSDGAPQNGTGTETRLPRSLDENSIDVDPPSLTTDASMSQGILSDDPAQYQHQQPSQEEIRDDFEVLLKPMQIRTFIVTISRTVVC